MYRIPPPSVQVVSNIPFDFEFEVSELTLLVNNTPMAGYDLENGIEISVDGKRYIDRDGVVFKDWDILTGTGETAGVFDKQTLLLNEWDTPANNQVDFNSCAVQVKSTDVYSVFFRTLHIPVAIGSFSLSFKRKVYQKGGVFIFVENVLTDNNEGELFDSYTGNKLGSIDYQTGVVRFSDHSTILESINYQYVSYEELPLDESMIGVDATRLPSDGRVPIYRPGGLAFIHHTETLNLEAPTGRRGLAGDFDDD